MLSRAGLLLCSAVFGCHVLCFAQSTQGLITGSVTSALHRQPVPNARVIWRSVATGEAGTATVNGDGQYMVGPLSPGRYRLRAEAEGFQALEVHDQELSVAGRLEITFPLQRISDIVSERIAGAALPGARLLIPVFGPDLQAGLSAALDTAGIRQNALDSSLSYVIRGGSILGLPLVTRNVYSLLAAVPGVTPEDRTGRSLGISVNGQRATASSFLVDGVENNDDLNAGPFTSIAPESTGEYRITTSNVTAEFGPGSGYVANTITQSGSNRFHAMAYGYLFNAALSANTFSNNSRGLPRQPYTQVHSGFNAGFPLWKDRLFSFTAYEHFRSRSRTNPEVFPVPILSGLDRCAGSFGRQVPAAIQAIFTAFPPPTVAAPAGAAPCSFPSMVGFYSTTRPVSFDRDLAVQRLDYGNRSGTQRMMARALFSNFVQPDFVFSVYPDLNSTLVRRTVGIAAGHTWMLDPLTANDLRFGWRGGRVRFTRPHPDVPALAVPLTPLRDLFMAKLNTPGSDQAWDLDYLQNNTELSEKLVLTRGRHTFMTGGGVLFRQPTVRLPLVQAGRYQFPSPGIYGDAYPVASLALNLPEYLDIGIDRASFIDSQQSVPGNPVHYYRNHQFSGFAQDHWRILPRLALNFGIRYESFGVLKSSGLPDGGIQLGPGASIQERLAGAALVFNGPLAYQAYRPDRNNFSGRFGIAWDPLGSGRTVLRASFGIFYDRIFDNALMNVRNRTVVASYCAETTPDCSTGFTYPPQKLELGKNFGFPHAPIPNPFHSVDERVAREEFHELLWIDPNLRSPYIQSWFASLQHRVAGRFFVEAANMGSLGRKLLTSDYVNRICSSACAYTSPEVLSFGRYNSGLGDLLYRSNSGGSSYLSLAVNAGYNSNVVDTRVAYTYSHSIDNQSDAMLGDVFDGSLTYPEGPGRGIQVSTFTQQFNSRIDRGNSDYDLRHNIVFYSLVRVPPAGAIRWLRAATSHWQLAQFSTIRAGFPYSVYSGYPAKTYTLAKEGGLLLANRRNLVTGTSPVLPNPIQTGTSWYMLNARAFSDPGQDQIGTLGRNSIRGPGFWNVDFSISRAFPAARWREGSQVEIRADAFNVFNHSNLLLSSQGFAVRGPASGTAAFPAIGPLYQTPRRVQLQLRISF